jgi:Nitrate/nitrite transporter
MSVLQKPDKGPVIHDWRPEDPAFWGSSGKQTATRNLWISIPALLLAFAVWMVWSTVIVRLNAIGFTFTTDQLFWLAALPGCPGRPCASSIPLWCRSSVAVAGPP